jgi:hypothetical protein
MSPRSLSRATIDGLLPDGPLWVPEGDEGFDNTLNAIAETSEPVRQLLASLADIRNPYKTLIFEDLERNYGFQPNENISLDIRIRRLARRIYKGGTGVQRVNSVDDIQDDLDAAGFDLQVHKNDPPVNPQTFLQQAFQISCGSDFAFCGYNNGVDILAFCANYGGLVGEEMLVNTPIYLQSTAFLMQCGGDVAYCGYTDDGINIKSVAGYFEGLRQQLLTYPTAIETDLWGKVFFVGGDATRDPVTGELLSIQNGQVDNNRIDELKALILEDKMLGSWCGLLITKV